MILIGRYLLLVLLFGFSSAWAQVSYNETHKIFDAFTEEYSSELDAQNAVLIINPAPTSDQPDFWWNLNHPHASYSTTTTDQGIRQHMLFIFGGFARIPGMTADALIKTICHEMAHGIGGAPFKKKQQAEMVSTEGQSDYFATSSCLRRIFLRLPAAVPPSSAFVKRTCDGHFSSEEERSYCYRAFTALELDIILFLENFNIETSFEHKDPTIVSEMNLEETFYPAPQCRLDTLVAGVLKLERPRCWWKP